MVLKLTGKKFDGISNSVDKVFAWMGHSILLGGGSNVEFLLEFRYFKDYRLGVLGYIICEVCNSLNDVVDGIFKSLG